MAIDVKKADDVADVVAQTIKQVGGSGNIVEDLFLKAEALQDMRTAMNKVRVAVRESLRNLDVSGILTDEQSAELAEIFPPRERGTADDVDAPDANGAAE